MKSTITSYSPMHSSSSSIFTNFPLISAFIAFTVAQSIKFFTTWYREKIWDLKQLVASGGMPSSHSATVTALAAAIGFQDGIGGPVFATSVIFACISRVNTRVFLSSWRRKVIPVVIVGAFLCAFVLYQQVMYDAFGVRLQAGRQAEVLNQIVYELPAEHPLAESRPLRELLGHTPPQVIAGALLGILTATIGHLIVRIVS